MSGKKDSPNSPEDGFDIDRLRELMELMEAHGVTEVNLREGEQHWRLRRGPEQVAVPMASAPMPAMPSMPVAAASTEATIPQPANAGAAASGGGNEDDGLVEIKCPTVGTFYSRPSPDDPIFVKVGTKVTPDSTVCLVEAMKVFNEVKAECTGTIQQILVNEGDAVDVNQVLFKVKP